MKISMSSWHRPPSNDTSSPLVFEGTGIFFSTCTLSQRRSFYFWTSTRPLPGNAWSFDYEICKRRKLCNCILLIEIVPYTLNLNETVYSFGREQSKVQSVKLVALLTVRILRIMNFIFGFIIISRRETSLCRGVHKCQPDCWCEMKDISKKRVSVKNLT